jgi:hypothetical protein
MLIGVIMTFATREVIATIPKPVEQKGDRVSDDSLSYKQRRDAFYKGVKVDIDDRIEGVHLVMPFEQLTEKQAEIHFSVPQKMKKQRLTVQEFKKLKNVLKYFVTIDGFQIDNTILSKYKPSDFESYSVIYKAKNAVTKEFPQAFEYHLYTPEYYNRLSKDADVINHFPDSVYKLEWFKELKNSRPVMKKRAVFHDVKTVMLYLDDSQPLDYTKLNKLPQYPGGTAKFNAFIQKNLILPKTAPKHISTYHLALVIEADGVVSRIKVLNAEDDETPNAFAKAMVNSAAWKPGILNGKAVRSQYAVKIDL